MPSNLTDHTGHGPEGPTLPPKGPTAPGAVGGAHLSPEHKQAITDIVTGFYRELSGKWQASTVLVDIWQGPNAVMVEQLGANPMSPGVAKSLISMLHTIIQAKPEHSRQALGACGALDALYGIALQAPERLDLLPFDALAITELTDDEARAWVRCCISLKERHALAEPVVIRTKDSVHLFEFAALKQFFLENFRFINPMTRKPVTAAQLMRLGTTKAAPAGQGSER